MENVFEYYDFVRGQGVVVVSVHLLWQIDSVRGRSKREQIHTDDPD